MHSYYDSVEHPKKPLVVVIGGAKVSSKLAALENMLKFVDCMIIGGAMANTFLAANGVDTKGSMIEADLIKTASDIMAHAKEKGIDLLLPTDLVVADRFDKDAESRTVSLDEIPDGWMALDIGPESAERFANAVITSYSIHYTKLYDIDVERPNELGSGISLGHPIGCTGARQMVTAIHQMERKGYNTGLICMCIGGGMGMAMRNNFV